MRLKKRLGLMTLPLLLAVQNHAMASDSYTIANGASTTINLFGTCRTVSNASGQSLYVPTVYSGEWSNFVSTSHTNVTLYNCCTTPWSSVIGHGSSVTAWNASSSCGGCASQSRSCSNGTLSGTYLYSSCTTVCTSCNLPWGGSIAHGASVTAYSSSTGCADGTPCSAYAQTRTCSNGSLSGSYTFSSCSDSVCFFDPCFIGGTLVLMADGRYKPIEEIETGDFVMGMGGSLNRVERLYAPEIGPRPLYAFNGGDFFVTAAHPFKLADGGWAAIDPHALVLQQPKLVEKIGKVQRLKVGDVLLTENDRPVQLASLESRDRYPLNMPVYDLSLDGNKTYYANGFLAHNKSCFVAGALVAMADGTFKRIEDIVPGDYVRGRYGEANAVLALDRVTLGHRPLYQVNGHHYTTDEHPHWTARGPVALNPAALQGDWGCAHPVILGDGRTVYKKNVGLTRPVQAMQKTDLLVGMNRMHTVDRVEQVATQPSLQLYNLVLGGSHTYFVDGYLVTGWPREDDFDYDAWTARPAFIQALAA